ncbi:MAG: metallophosphoesterase [Rikenellaceae bacterium]
MNYFFVSDVHLGLSTHRKADQTEKLFEEWLTMVREELNRDSSSQKGLFLVGDVFDFWFEYKHVIPKGFVKILALLQNICEDGIDVFMLKGNHDCWSRGYLSSLGIKFIEEPQTELKVGDINLYVAHGDKIHSRCNLGSKILFSIFNSKLAYRAFAGLVHPDLAFTFAHGWSKKNRTSKYVAHDFRFEQEPFVKYIRKQNHLDNQRYYYVFGHLHSPVIYDIESNIKLMVLGHWIEGEIMYGKLDENGLNLVKFK